jgi:glutamate/tyrosine decarboxylase-like PLP-dependent enzyme
MEALAQMDSVTIDPHKLGYVPYPAGAILLRDRRARELVAVRPPYLEPGHTRDHDDFLGRFILEGSKPGAAAAAVWLSHHVLPLDERGYGHLIERTVLGARRLHRAIGGLCAGELRAVLLPEPDLNIVCFALTHPSCTTLCELNRLNERTYGRMSLSRADGAPEYMITRTRLATPHYDGAMPPLLAQLAIAMAEWRAEPQGLTVLRATVMDPFLLDDTAGPDHVAGFVAALGRAGAEALGPSSEMW